MADRLTASMKSRLKISDYSSRSELLDLRQELSAAREAIKILTEENTRDEIEASQEKMSQLQRDYNALKLELNHTNEVLSNLLSPSKMDISAEILQRLHVPNLDIHPVMTGPFMAHSTCSVRDFTHVDFKTICSELKRPPQFHRKVWEWVYLVHQLRKHGVLKPGMRGIGFGVGTEALPSLFASLGVNVLATDAPPEIGVSAGWQSTSQFANNLNDLYQPDIVSRGQFEKHVTYAPCDMNAIDEHFSEYDFCWSSCCLEHLGSLQKGLDFIANSVEKTLKLGGVACHTTELNMSSNDKTIEDGSCVIYRHRDIEEFLNEMTHRGHKVEQFSVAPDTHSLDSYVDVPPYNHNPHLKLQLMGYVSTSVGLVITRGR
ncbi:hypothetical protein JMJ56_27750 [Belnapia sp. T18]|uniref:Methyltransferase type 11 domain-containing protein n=1 Tax=Belnapia arida TaxID=2804533 RepID=A0ABS1UAR9_9PROT|nr:hypothetical protein [Belnapia arida]MBL6081782.1 hypothetical protein [Belnapia arida]